MEKFENLNELIIALLLWITSNTDYINPKKLPEVKFLEQNELSQLACKNDCEILAYTPVEPNPPSPRSVVPSLSMSSTKITLKGSNVLEQI